jgi:hypothetical protein
MNALQAQTNTTSHAGVVACTIAIPSTTKTITKKG